MGFDNECILNMQSLPGEYFCPVCRTLVYPNEALQTQCTHLYCKPCLAYVVATTRACPYDGYLVTEADAKPLVESNKAIADAIEKIQVHCLYHRSNCQWQGSLSECIAHCASCSFGNSPVVCNRCGTQIIHRQVQEHAQICPGVQPQAQQTGAAQPPSSAEQNQLNQAASQASQQAAMQTNVGATPSLPSAPANVAVSIPAAASTTLPAAAPAGQAMAIAQPQVAAQGPTPEQWYQQQQLQYQQYYQQYPGYDPYQQQAQYQQQAYSQYPQPQMQSFPQATQAAQQPPAYAQPQPITQPQAQPPQQALPQQMQPHSLPQPQMQAQPQIQAQLYGHTPQMQVPVNAQQALAPAQQPLQQMQPQANPPSQMHMVAQQAAHLVPQAHLPVQPLQMQNPAHPQHQQLLAQQHPQLQQTPTHPQHQPQSQPQSVQRPQLQQYPQMPSQQHPHLHPQSQNLHQAHPAAQSLPQQPAAHSLTGHLSYPQPQQQQQMLPGPPQQRPVYMQPPQQGVTQQPPQHSLQMHSQPLPQQPQMRPTQMHMGAQALQPAMPPSQIGHPPSQPPVQQQIQQYPGTHPPAQHLGLPPQMGRPQAHPQHGPIPSQTVGLPHGSHPQGASHVQQYPSTHAQMQQSAPASQGMSTTPSQAMVPPGAQGAPAGGSPAPSRLGATEQTDKYNMSSEGKVPSGPTAAVSNTGELSGPAIQKQEDDFKKKDVGDNGTGDALKDNKVELPNNRVKEEHAGRSAEQSEGVAPEFIEGDENKPGKKQTQGSGEDGHIERATVIKAEGESDNAPLPHTSMNTTSIAGQTPLQLGGPGINPLPSNQDRPSSFPYQDSVKGEQKPPVTLSSEQYPSQMVSYGSLDMQHAPSQRPSGPDRMPPQHVPQQGPEQDRRFQGSQSYAMPPPGQVHMRPSGQSFVEHMPPSSFHPEQLGGQAYMRPSGQGFVDHMPPSSFHSEQLGGGFSDPGLQRGPGQLVPSQKMFEHPPQGHPPSSHALGPRMHAGPLPGPPQGGPHGPFDASEAMLARGPPPFHDSQMSMPRPPYPIQEDKFSSKMPGSFDSRQSDLRPPFPMEYGSSGHYSGAPLNMSKMNGPGSLPDSLSHGPSADRFQGFQEDRYKSLPDEGFKPLPDERFRSFPSDPARRRREFEEDLKQFPRHPLSDGDGISRMDSYSSRPLDRGPHSWGFDAGPKPFDKVTKPFGADGEPKFDAHSGAMGPRMFPPFPSDGMFGDRHLRSDIPKKSDFNQFDSNPPFGTGGRDLSSLSSNRFEGGSASGLNQSRFKDYNGRDPLIFGERPRPSGIHQSEPFGNVVPGSRFNMTSAPFDASETSRMIEQFGSGNPKTGDLDGPDFMAGKPRIGEPFGKHMPGLGSGSPRGFHSHFRMDEQVRFGNLPPHLRSREPSFPKESGPFGSDDFHSSDPSRKRVAGSAGWCRICKIDCDTVEGLDLHSQTREHQKVAMDIVRNIKKNSSKKQKPSEENSSLDDANKSRMTSFDGRGNRL